MNRKFWLIIPSLILIVTLAASPAAAAQDGSVVASAVIVPAQTFHMSFLTSALVKEVAVQEGDQVTAGQVLAVLNSPDLEYDLIAAQEALRSTQADAEIQRYKRVLDIRKGKKFWDVVPPEVRQRADARVAGAQATLEAIQALYAFSTLTAPQNATVASVDVLPGELVQQGQALITLATLDHLQLETTDLNERDVNRVRIGAPVKIFIEALNEEYTGTVTAISPIADNVGGDIVFKVTIDFDEQPPGLLWGMTAEVTIEES